MEVKQLYKNVFFIILFLPLMVSPQSGNAILTLNNNTDFTIFETRYDKYLWTNRHINLVSATYHLPSFQNSPLDHWTAPKTKLLVNGIPFEQFPFNFSSPNLLPLDFQNISDFELKTNPEISSLNFSPYGNINAVKNHFPDSLDIKLRFHVGSETGDPLIHVFTKENLNNTNKNKIPPSGSFSIADKTNDLNYSASLGYYGNFSTGSVNDRILLNKSSYFFHKQNKQISASADLRYKDRYSLSASAVTYYGWDAPPFLTSFIHFESYLYSLRGSLINIFDGFSFFLVNDVSITKIHKINGVEPGKIRLSGYKLISEFEKNINKINIKFAADLNYNSASDLRVDDNSSQKLFVNDPEEISYSLSLLSSYWIQNDISAKINLRYDNHFVDNSALSGQLNLQWFISTQDIMDFNISSAAAFPNLTELYSRFYQTNGVMNQDTFRINGNENLSEERVTHIGMKYSKSLRNLNTEIELYSEKADRKIRQQTLSTVISANGEILRDAAYINAASAKVLGTKLGLSYHLSDFKFLISWNFTENSDVIYFPKHSLFSKLNYRLPISSDIELNIYYNSKTVWDEFIVSSENDFYNIGSTGKLDENISLDFIYRQHLNEFYFMRDLTFSFIVRNIFNNGIKYFPIGNFLERTIIFAIQCKI